MQEYLQNLPIADSKNEIEVDSQKAFEQLLSSKSLRFRPEEVADFGVDGELEVFERGQATNFRAQVQLKGTRSLKPNKDGSYSLGDVSTRNLQYLLNGQIPIYVLHLQDTGEFRYVWARDEFKRLATENPNWIEQDTVTIRLRDVLDNTALDLIRSQIIKENSFGRQMGEMLIIADSSSVRVEVDPEALTITDQEQVFETISSAGLLLVNDGYANAIVERIGWLDQKYQSDPKIRLILAYAQYARTRYRTAIEILDVIDLDGQELLPELSIMARWIRSTSRHLTGCIDSTTHNLELGEIADADDRDGFSSYRFEHIRRQLLNEENIETRLSLCESLEVEYSKFSDEEAKSESGLLFSFIIVQCKFMTEMLRMQLELSKVTLRFTLSKNFFQLLNELTVLAEATARIENELHAAFDAVAAATGNPTLKADVAVEKVHFVINIVMLFSFHMGVMGLPSRPMQKEQADNYQANLNAAIVIYQSFGIYEKALRAKTFLADIHRLRGEDSEADAISVDVVRASDRMNYVNVSESALKPLSTLQQRIVDRREGVEGDEEWVSKTEDELVEFAKQLLTNVGLPAERLANVLADVKSNQNVSRARLEWCDQITIIQDLTHTGSLETSYSKPLEFWSTCPRLDYESAAGNEDSSQVIEDFKNSFCRTCDRRSPKKSYEQN